MRIMRILSRLETTPFHSLSNQVSILLLMKPSSAKDNLRTNQLYLRFEAFQRNLQINQESIEALEWISKVWLCFNQKMLQETIKLSRKLAITYPHRHHFWTIHRYRQLQIWLEKVSKMMSGLGFHKTLKTYTCKWKKNWKLKS